MPSLLFLLISLQNIILICNALILSSSSSSSSFFRRIRSKIPSFIPGSLPWYDKGLPFSCTECSKCCKVDGDVWLAPEEVDSVVGYVMGNNNNNHNNDNQELKEFRQKYTRAEIKPASPPSTNNNSNEKNDKENKNESWMCLKRINGACVFLDSESGQCSIYDVRPIQCSTYPFWPSIVESRDTWNDEAVFPDHIISNIDHTISENDNANDESNTVIRHWSQELGGCEGIGKVMDTVAQLDENEIRNLNNTDLDKMILLQHEQDKKRNIVHRKEIREKTKKAKRHWKRFPIEEIKMTTWYL